MVVEGLATQLAQLGHKIILVSPDTQETLRGTEASKLIHQHIYWDYPKPSVANARKLAEQLTTAGVDIAHFHAGGNYGWGNRIPFRSPAYYVSRAGIPTFWTSHRAESILDGFCGPQKPLPFKLMLLPIAWLGKVQQIYNCRSEIAVSRDNLMKMRRWYWPCRSRFVQIYHSRLPSDPTIATNRTPKPVVLCVGHLAAAKGQTILVEAFGRIAKSHSNFVLKLAGHEGWDHTLERIRGIIKDQRLENQVVLLGEQTNVGMLMREASIYVQPSLSEALGLALQEAMYYGCSCIGSRTGGIPELIQHEKNGLLFDPGNIDQLARALERLIDEQPLREALGRAATASIYERGMTLEKMTAKYLEVYERAAGKT